MDPARLAELLQPFLSAQALPARVVLSPEELRLISIYVELLLRWNARVNLTAVRDADSIVTRHFGESLFLAAYLFPGSSLPGTLTQASRQQHALDLGSGAGFPGLPLKIHIPELRLTLIESNHKKAAFLAEVIRALQLSDVSVHAGRLEPGLMKGAGHVVPIGIERASLVTVRAVERFESALQTAAALVRYGSARFGGGRLALLIGRAQTEQVRGGVCDFSWEAPVPVPQSRERVLLVGQYPGQQVPAK
jgi:16S rRNA (guanine527-N7)-methyltransferase